MKWNKDKIDQRLADKYEKFLVKFHSNLHEAEDEDWTHSGFMDGVRKGVLVARNNFLEIFGDQEDRG